MCEEKCLRTGLVGLSILLLDILAISLLKEMALDRRRIPVWALEVQLVVDDGYYPFAV